MIVHGIEKTPCFKHCIKLSVINVQAVQISFIGDGKRAFQWVD